MRYHRLNELFAVLLGLISLSFILWMTDGDRFVSGLAYSSDHGWVGVNNYFWEFIYTWAPLPAWLLGGVALCVLLAGFKKRYFTRYRRQAVFYILLLIIGPGLIVNVLLKDNLGRPRPREVIEFGGQHHYSQFWEAGETGANSSFPSGHASIGFALLGPWFIMRARKSDKAKLLLFIGCSWGGLVGVTRILQGGHFLSDVIWSGGLVYLTGQLLALWCLSESSERNGYGTIDMPPAVNS